MSVHLEVVLTGEMGTDIRLHLVIPFQIKSFLSVYEAVKTTINDGVGWWGINGNGDLGVSALRGLMCAGGMGCGRRWVRWVLRGAGTVSGHPGVS